MRRIADDLHVTKALLLLGIDNALVVCFIILLHQCCFLFAHFRLGIISVVVFTLPSLAQGGVGGGSSQAFHRLAICFVHLAARGTRFQTKHRQCIIYTHPSHVGFLLGFHKCCYLWGGYSH